MKIVKAVKIIGIPLIEIFGKGIAFLTILLIANNLSPEDFGMYNYVVSIVLFMSIFLDGGINNLMFNKSLKNDLSDLSRLFTIKVELIVIVFAVASTIYYFIFRAYYFEITLYTIALSITSLLFFLKFLARGQGNHLLDSLVILGEPIFRILAILLVVLLANLSLENVFISYAIIGILALSSAIYGYQSRFDLHLKRLYSVKTVTKFLIESKHFILYYLFMVGVQRIDIFFIEKNIGMSQVGVFSSAYSILLIVQLLFRSAITARLGGVLDNSREKKELFSLVSIFSLLGILIYFLSPYIFEFFFPLGYRQGSRYLQLLLLSIPFYGVNTFFVYHNNFRNRTRLNFGVFLLAFILKFMILYLFQFKIVESYIFQIVGVEILISSLYMSAYFWRIKAPR